MNSENSISKWALIRRNELVDIPEKLEIHSDFLKDLDLEEFEIAFRQIHDIFFQIYTDMSKDPIRFGCPIHKIGEYDYFSKEEREVRAKPRDIFYLMMYMFSCGKFMDNIFIIDAEELRMINKVKKTPILLAALCDYGFIFTGLKDFKITPQLKKFEVDYPDNRNVLKVFSLVADKVMNTQLRDVNNHFSSVTAFINGYISWNYKVLKEDLKTCRLADGCDYVSDKLHDKAEQEVVEIIHKTLVNKGFYADKGDPNEGPSIRYYKGKSKSAYDFAITSYEGTLQFEMRIRNAEICMEYLKECPERLIEIFRNTDSGCQNRINGTCRYGVSYIFENEEKWHCGCCSAQFKIYPLKEDIYHYIRLVELGNKR